MQGGNFFGRNFRARFDSVVIECTFLGGGNSYNKQPFVLLLHVFCCVGGLSAAFVCVVAARAQRWRFVCRFCLCCCCACPALAVCLPLLSVLLLRVSSVTDVVTTV